jgi:hypothetical protein
MQQSEIQVGADYALREPASVGVALQRVRVLERVRSGRWKVEWVDPNPGLVDYVKSKNLVTPWKQRREFLRDERHATELAAYNKQVWPGYETPLDTAAQDVFEATGEAELWLHQGILEHDPSALARVATRASVAVPESPYGYVDSAGLGHLPFDAAIQLAEAFATAEPSTVLPAIEVEERRMRQELREPGRGYLAPLAARYRAAWALIRQWASYDAAIADRDRTIEDLTQLLHRTMWELRRPDVDTERLATRIERALRGA